MNADIAGRLGFTQASSRPAWNVAIMPRTTKMGGHSSSGDCVGFISSRKRDPYDQS
jgi:hypothetical protein